MTTTAPTSTPVDNKVRQIVSNIRNLPTPPIVFNQIQKVINDPNVSAGQVAAILSEDPAMSVKVLKLTNSAFYGLAREVESVKQAVVVVGMEAIKNLVLSASVMDMFKGKDYDKDFQEVFWRHSLATAFGSRMLAKQLKARGIVDPDSAFSAGLLHDIGKVIVACFLAEEHAKLQQAREAATDVPDCELEREVLGYTHSDIGGLLAEQWKLPGKLKIAIVCHHHPEDCPEQETLPYIVHIADYIAKRTFGERTQILKLGELRETIVDHMKLTDKQTDFFCESLKEEYVKAETFMQMAGLGG